MFKLLNVPTELDGLLVTEENLNGKVMQKFLKQQHSKGLIFMGYVGGKLLFRKERIYAYLKHTTKESKP